MREIGGYFELEVRCGEHYHSKAVKLKTARNCFEYILRARQYTKVYIPYYTCEVILEPLRKCNVEWEFYHIDYNLEPVQQYSLRQNEAFLYTNYFGLKQSCVERLSQIYGRQLIIDNAQAFFSKPVDGVDTFYSARKFFGVPDGAYLYTDIEFEYDISVFNPLGNMKHLVGRMIDSGERYYNDFKESEMSFIESKMQKMSSLSERILASLDYQFIAEQRRLNYSALHRSLGAYNGLHVETSLTNVPMIYPFLTNNEAIRAHLIESKIFVATYWPNVIVWSNNQDVESTLVENLIPLPIDQRYSESDMEYIIEKIQRYGC